MAKVAKQYQNELERVKKNVESAADYFKPNYDRYHWFRNFVFKTSMSDNDRAIAESLGKPDIEFNILEAYISRQRGEFSKQEPSISVRAGDGVDANGQTTKAVENIMRAIIFDANNNSFEYDVYTDLMSGGFSVMKVWTEYENEMGFNQNIKIGRVYDPTLCGFDPMARYSHKGDGQYCFESYPVRKDDFEKENPGLDLSEITFTRSADSYNWSYETAKEEILMVCDYYEKKKKPTKIVKLSNGKELTEDKYKEYLEQWLPKGHIEQPAIIVARRTSVIETICRYRIIENQVIDYIETDFKYLPLIFVDGNSILLRDSVNSAVQQMTRPYVYHAIGAQRLKNFAGQSLGSELENLVQHKFKVQEESLPTQDDYLSAYTDIQKASVLVYKGLSKDGTPLNPPMEVNRVPIPPEIANTFSMSDQTVQGILGSYDASLGINNNQLSGIAIVEGATQSNAAAMPYVVGFLQALNQGAQIIVDLIPKYYVTSRTIPVKALDGKRDYLKINQPNNQGVQLNYSSNALEVNVEAGVNFAIQKSRALAQMIAMMQASPIFAQFINQDGLEELLDNMEMRGIDSLKEKAMGFMQNLKQQQQQQQQMAMQAQQNNPQIQRNQLEAKKLQQKAQQDDASNQLTAAQLEIDKTKAENDRIKALMQAEQAHRESIIQEERMQTEKMSKTVDLAVAVAHEGHRQHSENRNHERSDIELHHKILSDISQQVSHPSNTPEIN